MNDNQNNVGQNDYYNNNSYYSNDNYSDHYNNTSYTQEKKSNGLWWKLLLLIVLIVIIILLLLKFCGSGSKKTADEKFSELSNRVCEAAKTYISNNPSLMGTAEPGKSVVIKLQRLADANLISAQIENPYYDGNLFKKGTQDKYYSLSNSVRVMVAGDGSYYCEIVNNAQDVTPPELRLNGDAEITMVVGTDFEDPGYTATDDFDGDITDKVVRSGNVDNSKAGTYTLTYTVQDSAGNTTSKTRTVIYTDYSSAEITLGSILDGVTPMIKLRGANPYCMVKGTQYVEPGASATDNVDGNITDRIAVTNKVTGNIIGTFRLVYTVEDSSGNKAIAYRAVIVSTECPTQTPVTPTPTPVTPTPTPVVVNNAPVITLIGKNSITIAKGTEYIDLGATAYDKEDGDLTSKITTDDTQVNVNSAGIYKVIYRVTDSGGKTATKTRTVTVKDTAVVGDPQVRFVESADAVTVFVGEGNNTLIKAPKAVNENGVQVAVTTKIEDYTTKQAVDNIDWNKVGKYRVIYTAIHGNGTLKQTKTRVVTILNGKVVIGGKDTIEVALRDENCGITEADLIKGGVTFTAPGNETPRVSIDQRDATACAVGTYAITVTATVEGGESALKEITVKVVDKTEPVTPPASDAPGKVVIIKNSANSADPYNASGKWAGGTVTGIVLHFKATPASGTEIARYEYSKTCNKPDGNASLDINRTTLERTGSLKWTEEGQGVVCIRAVNTAGVPGLWSDPVKLYLDMTGPKAEFTHTWKDGVSNWHSSSSLTVTYTATDSGSGVDHFEYTYDDVKAKKVSEIETFSETSGKLTVKENTEPNRAQLYVYVRAVDKAGNKGEWTLKPAYANMDTVKPETPIIDKVDGDKTPAVSLTTRAKDSTSTRPSGIGRFIYTLNGGDEKSITANPLNSTTITAGCGNRTDRDCTLISTSVCPKSARPGVPGKDYTEIEDGCQRKSDYRAIIAMPSNTTTSNVNYDVRIWAVDRAGNRSEGYANKTVTVAPTKKPVTAVEIYNGDTKIKNGASCSAKAVVVGDSVTLTAVAVPKDADNAKNIEWDITGDKDSVALLKSNCVTVSGSSTEKCMTDNGTFVMKLVKEGTITVTAKIGTISSKCSLTIKKQIITCKAGEYLPKTKDKCVTCPAGSACKGGDFPVSPTEDQGIEKCPVGQYQDKTGQSKCITCPANTYNDKTGATKCTACPSGKTSPAGSTSSSKCVSETPVVTCTYDYSSSSAAKTAGDKYCADKYSNKKEAKVLGPDKCGKYGFDCQDKTTGGGGTKCGKGLFYNDALKKCVKCPTGNFCPGDDTQHSCYNEWKAHSTSPAGSDDVSDCMCASGFVLKNGQCVCATGTWNEKTYKCESTTPQQPECYCNVCTGNKYSSGSLGRMEPSACSSAKCPNGTLTSGNSLEGQSCGSNPTKCPAGQYRDKTTNKCKTCTAGYYCMGNEAIDPCPAHSWSKAGATSAYECACQTGYVRDSGKYTCNTCASGYHKITNGYCEKDTNESTNCAANMYWDSTAKRCYSCPEGYHSAAGSVNKTSCKITVPEGTELVSGALSSCKPGYYRAGSREITYGGSLSCSACPAGKYARGYNNTSCSTCEAGTVSSAGSSSCTTCAAGTYAAAGSSSCTPCRAGTYSGRKAGSCTQCRAGQYSAANSSSCSNCAAGTYSSAGSSSCTRCAAGTYALNGASACTKCPAGQYSLGGTSSCTQCSAGSVSSAGSSSCSPCSAGYSTNGNRGQSSCSICPAGRYSLGTGNASCSSCPSGYTSNAGATSMNSCYKTQYTAAGSCTCWATGKKSTYTATCVVSGSKASCKCSTWLHSIATNNCSVSSKKVYYPN